MGFGQYSHAYTAQRRYNLKEIRPFILPDFPDTVKIKRFGHNRFIAVQPNGTLVYYLHTSPIVIYNPNDRTLTLDLCGWPTVTTRRAMFQFGREHGLTYCWAARNGKTAVGFKDQQVEFVESVTLQLD